MSQKVYILNYNSDLVVGHINVEKYECPKVVNLVRFCCNIWLHVLLYKHTYNEMIRRLTSIIIIMNDQKMRAADLPIELEKCCSNMFKE